jgi:hypothetical protein
MFQFLVWLWYKVGSLVKKLPAADPAKRKIRIAPALYGWISVALVELRRQLLWTTQSERCLFDASQLSRPIASRAAMATFALRRIVATQSCWGSLLVKERSIDQIWPMSALTPSADLRRTFENVGQGPILLQKSVEVVCEP